MHKPEFDVVTEGYLSYLEGVKRLSRLTLSDIRCTYRKMAAFAGRRTPAKAIWELSLDEWMEWVGETRNAGRSTASISKELCHARGLLEYAWRNSRIRANVLDGFNLQDADSDKAPPVLTMEEAERLIKACPVQTAADRRTRLVILLLYGCGLRTGELCKLNVQDLDHERREIAIHLGKGDISRRVAVPDAVWTEILAYLAERSGKRGALFKTLAKKVRFSCSDVLTIVHTAGQRAGLGARLKPKDLRHTYASHLMDAGVDIAVISQLMGHRSPRETGIYLHALTKRKEAAVRVLERDWNKEAGK
jgi:site-specific recombinase XerD